MKVDTKRMVTGCCGDGRVRGNETNDIALNSGTLELVVKFRVSACPWKQR